MSGNEFPMIVAETFIRSNVYWFQIHVIDHVSSPAFRRIFHSWKNWWTKECGRNSATITISYFLRNSSAIGTLPSQGNK